MSHLTDARDKANYAYEEALMGYEDALQSRDPEQRSAAEIRLSEAGRVLSAAQSAVVLARHPAKPVTFTTLLNDPMQQLGPNGEVMRSIRDYQNATTNTPSAIRPSERTEPS